MKKLKNLLAVAAIVLSSSLFQSCGTDEDYYYILPNYPNALVTVKNAADSTIFLQLDDFTTVYPVNVRESPYGGKEVRALVNFTPCNADPHGHNGAVFINWMDSILTKPAVPGTGSESDDEYGSDPVEIVNDWVTIAEDGYLTLRFRAKWGNSGIAHRVNLLTGVNPNDPYEVEFRHDAEGDDERKWGDGLVAFSLKDLPDTEGKTVTLKLRWQSYSGTKQANFKFCSRKTTESANLLHGSPKFVTEIE